MMLLLLHFIAAVGDAIVVIVCRVTVAVVDDDE